MSHNRRQRSISAIENLIEPINPLMVAVSGFIDSSIEGKAKKAGFEMVYESPLSEY